MANIGDVKVHQKISFEVHPVSQLGNGFKDVEYCGSFDAQLAMMLGNDLAAMHGNMYPTLPAGTPADYLTYTYFRVKLPGGAYQVLAEEWVRAGSVTISGNGNGTLNFNNISREEFDKMITACRVNGRAPDSSNFE